MSLPQLTGLKFQGNFSVHWPYKWMAYIDVTEINLFQMVSVTLISPLLKVTNAEGLSQYD